MLKCNKRVKVGIKGFLENGVRSAEQGMGRALALGLYRKNWNQGFIQPQPPALFG